MARSIWWTFDEPFIRLCHTLFKRDANYRGFSNNLSPNSTIIRHRIRDLLRSQQIKMSKQGNSSDKKRESLSGSYSGVIPNFSDSFEAKTASCLLLLLDFDTIWKIIKTKQNSQEWLVITGLIWHVAVCGFSLHLGSSESHKTLEQKFIFQISTLNSQGINKCFSFN